MLRLPLRTGTEQVRGWTTAIASDPAAVLFAVAVALLILVLLAALFAARARRRERQRERERLARERVDEVPVGRWVEEGRRLLNHWQERIERLDELQSRLAAMAQEVGQLKAQVSRMDELRAENLRLSQETEALSLERDQLRGVLARIGELIQRASETRPRPAGDAAPGGGP